MNEMKLTIDNEVFDTMRKNFDTMLERTVGSMIMRNADESTITLKIAVSLDHINIPSEAGGFRDSVQPSFKHDISSVMQVKDKMSGTFKGNVELIFDENGKPIIRDIDDGQVSIFDEDLVTVDEEDSGQKALPASKPELPELGEYTESEEMDNNDTPFDWLMKYRNKSLRCQNKSGTFNVIANADKKIILSSGFTKDDPFYISGEKLKPHVGENLICVTSPEEGDDPDAIEIWCDDCGAYLFGINNPRHKGDSDGYTYDAPEETGA